MKVPNIISVPSTGWATRKYPSVRLGNFLAIAGIGPGDIYNQGNYRKN